ncbi:MAG: hypothetical protein AB8B69_14245 [Chitinophagales bacterium]
MKKNNDFYSVHNRFYLFLITLCTIINFPYLHAQTPIPNGNEFQVNTHTSNNQRGPGIALDEDGNFVVSWGSSEQDGSDSGIYAQLFNKDGSPKGNEFRVNTTTASVQSGASVGMDRDGDFVIAWQSDGQDGSGFGIYAKQYDKNGNPTSGEFQVNSHTSSSQVSPSVAMDCDGNFVITWTSDGQDGSGSGIYAQRYNSDGTTNDNEFLVNTHTDNNQEISKIDVACDGHFIITWQSLNQDGSANGIFAQRYNNDGTIEGGEFQVNTYTANHQAGSNVGINNDGVFVIAWQSKAQASTEKNHDVYAQLYNNNGTPNGSEFLVNTVTINGAQSAVNTDIDEDGNFVIAWQSGTGFSFNVFAQLYDSNGMPEGNQFRVNTFTSGRQRFPSVGMVNDGDFVIALQSEYQDGSGDGIFARRYGVFSTNEVPTLSEWGLLILALLLMILGTLYLLQPRFDEKYDGI